MSHITSITSATSIPVTLPPLADTATAALRGLFASGPIPHEPSTGQWAALGDLLRHLDDAARGLAGPSVYLSAIPAGTGKSSSLAAYAAALCASSAHAAVGMLILCSRVAEVRDMAAALQPCRDRLHVICDERKNPEVVALGGVERANAAQIVVATQAALKASLRGQSDFSLLARFHYRGRARAIRCWDEAYSMRRPVILDSDSVQALAGAIRKQSSEAVKALRQWSLDLEEAPTGPCEVPDFGALGVDFGTLEDDCLQDEELLTQAKALRDVSGQRGWIIPDNLSGPAMVRHIPELPASLLPVLVTDASAAKAVNHEAYRQMEVSGLPIVRLTEAGKTYRNLMVRIVPASASRSVFTDRKSTRGRELIDMAVRYVRSVAPAEVLIVAYKKTRYPLANVGEKTIAAAIDARLTQDERLRVRHISWGAHTATNSHSAVRHVLLLGLNFTPASSQYADAAAQLAKPMMTADPDDHPAKDDISALRDARLRDSVLQAVLRGAARKGRDGDCGEMETVIVQTTQTGLSVADYAGMFPGCRITTDQTLMGRKDLTGRLAELAAAVRASLERGDTEIAYSELRDCLAMDAAQFRRLTNDPRWSAHLDEIDVIPARLSGRRQGLRAGAARRSVQGSEGDNSL